MSSGNNRAWLLLCGYAAAALHCLFLSLKHLLPHTGTLPILNNLTAVAILSLFLFSQQIPLTSSLHYSCLYKEVYLQRVSLSTSRSLKIPALCSPVDPVWTNLHRCSFINSSVQMRRSVCQFTNLTSHLETFTG